MSTFYIQQFGCRATQADGAALERQLLDRGCTPAADPALAEIVVLNTCTVTAAADAQARDAIRKIHARNPAARLIVTGCYAQRAPEELAALPGVNWVIGNSHKPQIPSLITQIAPATFARAREEGTVIPSEARNLLFLPAPIVDSVSILTGDIFAHPEFLSAPIQGGESHRTRPILKIQDGCNNRCSFCVIPYVRGKSRSLPPDAVIFEIQRLTAEHPLPPANSKVARPILAVHSRAREIVLSGINLGTYGRDLSPRIEFIGLLRRILDETSLERLRISSIEPQDLTLDLIDLFASTDRIAQHFHIPLQSASDRILAAMHRWYRSEHYARRVELIHDRLPHAAIGADVIAGFPGETESDHAATLAFIERLPFTYLHVFSYSPRPGTKAASLQNHVPAATIKRRARELRSLGESKSAAFRHSQQGRPLRVLTLHRDEHSDADTTPALSTNYLTFSIPGKHTHNRWLEIEISAIDSATVTADTNDRSVAASLA
ncbi:MAG TPA: MiaB/RimO family radical SAM methylthiotransferase [Candidatus Acidoferrum sp.]|nr:MiaB/RimO family radical SAM methylthiotransferase [Candidatus Acidoferrum sp.]